MKKVLITGGSEGIGFAFAKAYAVKGDAVFLAARNEEKLASAADALQIYNVPVRTIACDLSQPGAAQKLFALVQNEKIDILINNAGFGHGGESCAISVEEDEAMIQVNVTVVMTLTKLFVKQMKERNEGTIVNVASTGAFQPGPYIASYYASKTFVLQYTKAVAEELKGTGIHICCLCPGPVDTAFYKKAGTHMSAYHMSAEQCVSYAMKHMKDKTVLIPGFWNRVSAVLPQSLKTAWLYRQKKNKK